MRRNTFIFSLILTAGFVGLQSTVLQRISINGVVPDIALIIIVFSSNSMGAMRGQYLGFFGGLIQDFMGSAPLGFNALTRTLIGYIFGKLKGKLFLDSILLPVIFVVSATLVKEGLFALTGIMFLGGGELSVFGKEFLIELGLNTFLSPFVFALLKLLRIYRTNEKDGY